MAKKKRAAPRKNAVKSDNLLVRLGPAEKATFADAAALSGLSLSAWVRERLRRVARRELEDAGRPVGFLAESA
jgi:hypothetical protein